MINYDILAMITRVERAERNYKRAVTRHLNEQAKGNHDLSVRQTRRMALAVRSLQRALFELTDAKRALDRTDAQRRNS